MARLLAIFNLIACGASIAGLVTTMRSATWSPMLTSILLITLLFCGYVAFVPGSRVERNVRSKLDRYQDPTGQTLTIQRGTFELAGLGSVSVEFDEPFAAVPGVEVINERGHDGAPPEVLTVTPHQATFGRTFSAPGERQTFRWVARGTPLTRVMQK